MKRLQSENPGSRQALIGGLLGLAVGLFLSGFRAFAGPPPQRIEEAPGNAVFALILVSPYIIALVSRRLAANVRAPLLLAASLLSFASVGISLAGAGVLFLPATVMLAIATARSFGAGGGHGLRRALPIALALVAAVVVGLAFASLFIHKDPRCWAWVKYDGRTEWSSAPVPPGSFQGSGSSSSGQVGPLPPGATSAGSECTSDIITPVEACKGLGILATGATLLATGSWAGRPLNAPP